jgi:hypothetical protein
MSLLIQGQLTQAQNSTDNQSFFLQFYHTTSRFGLPVQEFVSVALEKEHTHLAPRFAALVGKEITLPVKAIPTKKGSIFYVTAGDGLPVVD